MTRGVRDVVSGSLRLVVRGFERVCTVLVCRSTTAGEAWVEWSCRVSVNSTSTSEPPSLVLASSVLKPPKSQPLAQVDHF